jgi:hypothetical protein
MGGSRKSWACRHSFVLLYRAGITPSILGRFANCIHFVGEVFGRGQFADVVDAKIFHKLGAGAIQNRATDGVSLSLDFNQAFIE